MRNLVVKPVYRGELRYGQRSDNERELIVASIEPLMLAELWQAAQETLARNRAIGRRTRRGYLLRSVIRCGLDGLTDCGSQGRGVAGWYRCNGQLAKRGRHAGRCPNNSLRVDVVDAIVWSDISAGCAAPATSSATSTPRSGARPRMRSPPPSRSPSLGV